jgi:hypothetical protein
MSIGKTHQRIVETVIVEPCQCEEQFGRRVGDTIGDFILQELAGFLGAAPGTV